MTSISLASVKQARLWLACSLLVPICINSVMAAEPSASIKAPKVTRSLLLDVDKAGERIVVVGEKGHIIYSDDKGQSWTQSDVQTAQMVTSVSFADDKQGWAVAHDGHVLHSVNAGESWTVQRNGLEAQALENIRALNKAKKDVHTLKLEIASAASNQDVLDNLKMALDDAEWELESYTDKSQNAPIANPLLDVWFMDDKKGWAVGAFGEFFYTKNGGMAWHDASKLINNEMGYHLNAVTGTADGVIYIGGEAGFLVYSKDAGETWQQAELNSDSTIFDIQVTSDGKAAVSTGLRAQTFRSADNGETWQQLNPEVGFSLAGVDVTSSGELMLVGAGGSIAYSDNGGDDFSLYTLPSRTSLSATLSLGNGDYLIVGEGGVVSFSPAHAEANNK